MLELLAILGSFAAIPACFFLGRWIVSLFPAAVLDVTEPFHVGPSEPCWTEAIVSDGRYSYARGQCVNDVLIELDGRARRGEWPFIPIG